MIVDSMMVVGVGGILKQGDLTLRTRNAGIATKELNRSRMEIEEEEPWKDALTGWY